jgi:outer membrane protein assembly factor BamB
VIAGENVVPGGATGDRIYVKTVNRLYALDLRSGEALWTYRASDYVSLPAIAGEQIYVIVRSGGRRQLSALRLSNGRLTWNAINARLSNAAPVVAGGRVYVRTIDGSVLVYT